MTGQALALECSMISAVARLEEIAALTEVLLEGEMSKTSFEHRRIYYVVRAIDNLAHDEIAQQARQEQEREVSR